MRWQENGKKKVPRQPDIAPLAKGEVTMLSSADNELLTRTGPGTTMGEYFRRFWQPIALSSELPEPDCAPIRVQVMSENFVAFRDTKGRVGLIEPRCPHRGANLFFGRNEEGGIRCIYHGWKFDVQGKCLELPNVPPGSGYFESISIKAYPTREFGEIVWAYLGPPERMPEDVPQLEFGTLPASHRYVTKRLLQCNWAHSFEGALDTAHFSFLHMPAPQVTSNENPDAQGDERRMRWVRNDAMPRFTIIEHEVGFLIGGARRADGRDLYWRTTQFMLPAHATTPSTMPGETYFGYTWVPITDEACWIYTYAWNPDQSISDAERTRFGKGYGQMAVLGPGFVPVRNRSNDYLIDRADQKHRTFTGVRGVAEQDAMVQESQGVVADRTREHLTPTDVAIVRFRRTMLDGAKALRAGTEPEAPHRHGSYGLRSGSCVAGEEIALDEVMKQRFGSPIGRVVG
jgi:phenylpropionate dioxygenase-like ring-hydroxylating dioxygenase large terminal subunit